MTATHAGSRSSPWLRGPTGAGNSGQAAAEGGIILYHGRLLRSCAALALLSMWFLFAACSPEQPAGKGAATTAAAAQSREQTEAGSATLDSVLEGLPEMLAEVEGKTVTKEQLRRLLHDPTALSSLEAELGSLEYDSDELKRLAVRMLVRRHLILEEGERRGLAPGDSELDEAVVALRRRFQDLESFGVWMRQRAINEESLFSVVAEDMLATRVREAIVEDVQVSEEQIEEYYKTHREELGEAQEVRLGLIVVQSSEQAASIVQRLRAGEDFARIAQQESSGIRADQGGDTGWVQLNSLDPPMRELVETLVPGEAAGPVQTEGGELLIVGLHGVRSQSLESLAEARDEIVSRLLPEAQQEALDAWLDEREREAQIKLLF